MYTRDCDGGGIRQLVCHKERRCPDGVGISLASGGENSRTKTGSYLLGWGSYTAWLLLQALQKRSQENSPDRAVAASPLPPSCTGAVMIQGWPQQQQRVQTALDYLSKIVSTTQVVLIIQYHW